MATLGSYFILDPNRRAARASFRQAFTLVELLMVIVIIGMLIALLLPAVNAARESAKANTCRNNLRQLALAIVHYDTKQGKYPGVVDGIADGTAPNRYLARPLIYMILPELERTDLYDANNGVNQPQNDVVTAYLAFLVCPSDPQSTGAPTSYVYNTGMPGPAVSSSTPWGPGDDNPANGVFAFRFRGDWKPPTGGIGGDYITDKDGTSQTLMLSENIDAGNWQAPVGTTEVDVGWVWHDVAAATPPLNINGLKGERNDDDPKWARPSSNHGQIVNVAFCDGHVRTLRENVAYHVLAQLMTSWGRWSGRDQSPTGGPQNLPKSPRSYFLNSIDYE